jgi:hypothetical protein
MSRQDWIAVAIVVGTIALLTLIGTIKLIRKLFATRRMLGEVGTDGKIAFWGSLLYTIFPVDLLPDPIYLDDMAVLGTALVILNRMLRARKGRAPLPTPRSTGTLERPVEPRRDR